MPKKISDETKIMKPVFKYTDGHVSFEYRFNECVLVGETDGTLEEFLEFEKGEIEKIERGLCQEE